MKLETIKRKLENEGIISDYIMLTGIEKPVKALRCDTNYNGMYPTTDTWEKINAIRKLVKNNRVECRGYYTAVFIYECEV